MSDWEYVHWDEFDYDEAGKWLLFFSLPHIDEWWTKIKEATEQGELGPAAKVSLVSRGNRRVIGVYARDEDQAMEIREKLREMGVEWSIHFKWNWMSASGQKGSAFSA